MRFKSPRRFEPAFNLTPLIDILFIVLIFLVLTTTFKEATTFQVNLPRATTGTPDVREAPGLITIGVAPDGTVEIGGAPVTLADLSERLGAVEDPEEAHVRFRADAGVSHGVVVRIMDAVRRSGIYRLSIETEMDTRSP